MADKRHNPDDRFRRDPRDWGRFKWGYIAHAAQGFFTCADWASPPSLFWRGTTLSTSEPSTGDFVTYETYTFSSKTQSGT